MSVGEKRMSPQLAYYYRNRQKCNRARAEAHRREGTAYAEKMKHWRMFGTFRLFGTTGDGR